LGKKSLAPLSDEYNFEVVFSHEFALITSQISEEQKKNLAQALSCLTGRQREAIFLRYYEGLSYEEIATLMSVTVKTAYNFVYMAITELRKFLTHPFIFLLLFRILF
jgi:RNA polymerase sigma factor (sigma-70 family)